jgi:hypothetical protein
MKRKIDLVNAEQEHIDYLKGKLRTSDVSFAVKYSGGDVNSLLQTRFDGSILSWVVLLDDVPFICFGVESYSKLNVTGFTWMVATDVIYDNRLSVARGSIKVLQALKSKFDKLVGLVDENDKISLAWHKWLGFKIQDKKIIGVQNTVYRYAVLGG